MKQTFLEALAANRFTDLLVDANEYIALGVEMGWYSEDEKSPRVLAAGRLEDELNDALLDGSPWSLELLIDARGRARDDDDENGGTRMGLDDWTLLHARDAIHALARALQAEPAAALAA